MALFPAYSARSLEEGDDDAARWPLESDDVLEDELLASDTEEEMDTSPETEKEPAKNDDYYVDCKMDNGNRRVSTLYYPGRPQYERSSGRLGEPEGDRAQRSCPRRYFWQRVPDTEDSSAVQERAAVMRRVLEDTPQDVELWEKYIDFMESYGGEKNVIDAVELAVSKNGRSRRLRMRWYAVMRHALPPQPYAERLRENLAKEKDMNIRLELWLQLVRAPAAASELSALDALVAAAMHDTHALPCAYPDLFYAYGVWVRAAGLWEQLVLLVELVAAMNFPRAAFPPPKDLARERYREAKLREIEDKIIESGLPLSTVWVRVERARAAAHWRAYVAGGGGGLLDDGGDPQRTPQPHDVADLLRPVADQHQLFRLSVRMLMLAKVPLLCGAGWSAQCGRAGAEYECGEELLGALATARALTPRHPAHLAPDTAQRLLAIFLDPPHYFTDEYGYLSWVSSLWEACCGWARGARRTALLCWRLRWLRALLLAAHADSAPLHTGRDSATTDAEIRRMRADAKSILRRLAGAAPLAFVEWARLEAAAGGLTAAARAARHALRAAIRDRNVPHHHVLYIARVGCEVGSTEGQPGMLDVTSLVAAVLRNSQLLICGTKQQDLLYALEICEKKCDELQRKFSSGAGEQGQLGEEREEEVEEEGEKEDEEEEELAALLPSRAEWGAVRVLLYTPWRRARVLSSLLAQPYTGESCAGARYWEQQATALAAVAGSAAAARSLAAHCPHSLYLNIVGASAPLWAQAEAAKGACGAARRGVGGARGAAVLAQLLPALGRALHSEWAHKESEWLVRAVRRALVRGAGCGWVGVALRLEAEGHAARPRLPHALYAALHHTPHHKWMYVRGAVWCGGEATSLADTLLDKLLRLHTLPHELQPLLDAQYDKNKRSEHAEGGTEHVEGGTEHAEGGTEHDASVPNEETVENYVLNEPLDVFMEPQDAPLAERHGFAELRDVNDASEGSLRGT